MFDYASFNSCNAGGKFLACTPYWSLFWITYIHKSYSNSLGVFSSGCKNSMNHLREGVVHEAKHRCRYSAHYDNRIYTCKVGPKQCNTWPDFTSYTYSVTAQVWHCVNLLFQACYESGKEVIVVPKTTASSDSPWFGLAIYAWSGWVMLLDYSCTKVHLLQFI